MSVSCTSLDSDAQLLMRPTALSIVIMTSKHFGN